MEKFLEKSLLAGLGLISITRENAEKIVDELIKKGELAREEKPEFVNKLLEKGKITKNEIEKLVENTMKNVIDRMNIAKVSDVEELKHEIESLKKEIKEE